MTHLESWAYKYAMNAEYKKHAIHETSEVFSAWSKFQYKRCTGGSNDC